MNKPETKRKRYIVAYQAEDGSKGWDIAKSLKEAQSLFWERELADGTAIAIQYVAEITGTAYQPGPHKRMKKMAKGE